MASETQLVAENIIRTTLGLLTEAPRPRKLPGKKRAEAIDVFGKPINPRVPTAYRFSLPGAVKKAAYLQALHSGTSTATVSRAKKIAVTAFVNAYFGGTPLPSANPKWLTTIDDSNNDTREIARALKRAAKQLSKS